jgi:hypothetical protein
MITLINLINFDPKGRRIEEKGLNSECDKKKEGLLIIAIIE